jgi:molybdopterin-binding protein
VAHFRISQASASSEAVEDLGLAPGVLAVAVIKSTNVVVEIPAAAIHRLGGEGDDSPV